MLFRSLGIAGVAYLFARVIGKSGGIWFVSRWKSLGKNIGNYLGIGMSAQAGVAIGLIGVVERTDPSLGTVITPIILATILIYETLTPPAIEWVLFRAGDVRRHF